MRLFRRRKRGAALDNQVTACCDAEFVVKCVGAEVFLVCATCGEHIGHLVDRTAANVSRLFESYLRSAMLAVDSPELSRDEVDMLYGRYISHIEALGPSCVKQLLLEHLDEKGVR